ncbi:MAG: type II secretion system GspH family protein [Candidatus Eremiobacteraeota bacterium]|nr:type II secretion system GspH family protein [Candidatus Eremiobacteraeota bacterium]
MKNNKHNQSGFTVLEMTIATLLMGICLAAISQIITDYNKSLRYIQEKEKCIFGIQMGLHRIADELREANEVTHPSAGSPDNKIIFKKRVPPFEDKDYQTDSDEPDFGIYLTDPLNESPLQKVKYYVQSGNLYRQVLDDSDAIISTSALARDVNVLSVTRKKNGEFKIKITIDEFRPPSQQGEPLPDIETTVQVRGKI